ncbi:hypothetical protein SEA_JACOREN57_68 [Mycobacterium phage JacoRen57]|nr:hypothetical protein SEA_JACOREN57_68 [Mycobacterium phage JacoRen57]
MNQNRVLALLGSFAIGVAAAAGIMNANAIASPGYEPMPGYPDIFSQETFPCAEDEVLGYAPQFGPDRVGCIHIDVIRNS